MTVFDSQGNAHDMSVYFVKTGDNDWQVYTRIAVIQDSETATTLKFNANGTLVDGAMANNIQPAQLTAQNPPRLA
ncbi:flagellar basal body FlgE domain-containing protein [Shigella flexneri]